MTANRFVLALLCAALLAVSTVSLRAQTTDLTKDPDAATPELRAQALAAANDRCDWLCQLREAQSQQLEGSWEVIVTPVVPSGVPQPPSFHVYSTYSRGGGYTASDRTRPFSKQHGAWEHLGSNHFAGTAKEDIFDAMGNFAGTLTVRTRTTLTGRDTFVGVANGEFRDAAGNITRSLCTTFRATRLKVEPLPEQCQSIQPPE